MMRRFLFWERRHECRVGIGCRQNIGQEGIVMAGIVLTPDMLDDHGITIIGVGSEGSRIFSQFWPMIAFGWSGTLTLIDPDHVDERNLRNQRYLHRHAPQKQGKQQTPKVLA